MSRGRLDHAEQARQRRLQILQTLAEMLETPRGEKSPPPPWRPARLLRGRALPAFRQQSPDVRRPDQFIEQSLFGVINQITSEKARASNRSNSSSASPALRPEKPGHDQVLIGDAWSAKTERLRGASTPTRQDQAALKQALRIAATQENLRSPTPISRGLADLLRCYAVGRWEHYARSSFAGTPGPVAAAVADAVPPASPSQEHRAAPGTKGGPGVVSASAEFSAAARAKIGQGCGPGPLEGQPDFPGRGPLVEPTVLGRRLSWRIRRSPDRRRSLP